MSLIDPFIPRGGCVGFLGCTLRDLMPENNVLGNAGKLLLSQNKDKLEGKEGGVSMQKF